MKLILTCEHASNELPSQYISLFETHQIRLNTHEGYDIGAFEVYKSLQFLADYSAHYPWSRLLIEVNRSLSHPNLFSSISSTLSKTEKNRLINDYYQVYRNQIQQNIDEFIAKGETVLHLSIHSFTPVWNEIDRNAEIGILYDPSRKVEQDFAKNFKTELKSIFPNFRIRMNYPYLGKSDGLTTNLRNQFPKQYLGIEIEINQKLFEADFDHFDFNEKLCEILKHYIKS
ncbi:N-formylglutamate amidohydrolase [Psychroflexus montanilacus]|uniref:N-formylglutamate amidohydrolase n=1 Tax=Psychroflexus montanilacus TaxID=2873598 RepID=UPI001CC980FA|nr:N-formylglutamate amidohydrolase [Psychroflexus montanilacus]MBZ9650440.1 N-formylglutamate amidohydrolase [Psychroflexus montanilacus]